MLIYARWLLRLLVLSLRWSGSVQAKEQTEEDEEERHADRDAHLNARLLVKDDAKRE